MCAHTHLLHNPHCRHSHSQCSTFLHTMTHVTHFYYTREHCATHKHTNQNQHLPISHNTTSHTVIIIISQIHHHCTFCLPMCPSNHTRLTLPPTSTRRLVICPHKTQLSNTNSSKLPCMWVLCVYVKRVYCTHKHGTGWWKHTHIHPKFKSVK
jgi:hypothetical protein